MLEEGHSDLKTKCFMIYSISINCTVPVITSIQGMDWKVFFYVQWSEESHSDPFIIHHGIEIKDKELTIKRHLLYNSISCSS